MLSFLGLLQQKGLQSENNIEIVKCVLDQIDNFLLTIALSEPAAVTLGMSGSIQRLRKLTENVID